MHLPAWTHPLLFSTDPFIHELRVVALEQCHSDGVFWPLWLPHLASGHRYALFHYYPPGFYQLASGLTAVGLSPRSAMLVVLVTAALAGGLALAGMLRRHLDTPWVLLGLVLWFSAPHHQVNLQVWNTWPQQMGLWLLPLVLVGVDCLLGDDGRKLPGAILLPLGLAAQLVVHNVTALFAVLLVVVYGSSRMLALRSATGIGRVAVCGVVGAGLAAFQWVPAILDMDSTQVSAMTANAFDGVAQAVYPSQLIGWEFPRGMSLPGPDDEVSLSVGPLHAVAWLLALVFGTSDVRARDAQTGLFLLLAAAVLAFIITPAGAPTFVSVPLLRNVNVPARFLGLIALLVAVGVPFCLSRMHERWGAPTCAALSLAAVLSFVPAVLEFPETDPFLRRMVAPALEGDRQQQEQLMGLFSTSTVFHEYLPAGTNLPRQARPPASNAGLRLDGYDKSCRGVELSGVQGAGGFALLPLVPYADLRVSPEGAGTLTPRGDHMMFRPSEEGPFSVRISYNPGRRYGWLVWVSLAAVAGLVLLSAAALTGRGLRGWDREVRQ